MGLFDSVPGKKEAQSPAPPPPNSREALRSKAFNGVGATDADAPDEHTDAAPDGDSKSEQPGFLRSHFGNPDSGEVYGTGNDYETEEQMDEEEKVSANQSLWYIGIFTLLVFLGYFFFT